MGSTGDMPPPIDPAALSNLKEIGGGDASFVEELITMFREDSPPRLADIESAMATGDAASVAKHSHSLKGSGSNFGAARFREISQAIETAGKAGDLGPVPALLAELNLEYARVIDALDRAVADGL